MYRPPAASVPAKPGQAPRHIQSTAVSRLSQVKSKKRAPKKRRRSKAASSSEEESSLASEDARSDSADSDTHDSDFGAGSVTHKHHRHAKQQVAESDGMMSRQDEEEFYEALTKFWGSQGSSGKRILAKYQPFESMRLTSGMPTFGAHHFWAAVMAIGGHSVVSTSLSVC